MKPIHLLAAFAFSMSGLAFAAGGHGHAHKPLHGGVVSEVKDMDYELVAKPDLIQLYLRDHGKPVDVSKVSAKVTLLTGSQTQDIELKPDSDKLSAIGTFQLATGTKAIALISIGGKTSTVRFVLK